MKFQNCIQLWILTASVILVSAQRVPRIDQYFPNLLSIKAGEKGQFICEAPNAPTAVIKWFRVPGGNRNQMFEIKFPNPNFKKGDGDQYPNALVIENANAATHDGFYTCTATNAVNSTIRDYNLQLQVMFLNDEFEYTPRDTFFYSFGDRREAWANCKPPLSAPALKPKWINGSSGKEVIVGDDPRFNVRYFSREGLYSQMVLDNATIYDTGTWTCRYVHNLGTKEATFQVKFYGDPKPPQNVSIKANRLNGVIIQWNYLRNDLEFYDFELIKTSTNEKTEYLMREHRSYVIQYTEYEIKELELATDYKIRLRARSDLKQVGEWSEWLNFRTVNELKPVILLQPISQSIGEGVPHNIMCGVQANPLATIVWYRNGKVIPESDTDYVNNGLQLLLVNPKHGEDNADAAFKCTATNKLGSVTSEEAKMTVEYMDGDWLLKPRSLPFYHGDKFLRISARPPKGNNIVLRWYQNNKIIWSRTHPSYSKTNYLDPNRILYYALDIKNLDRNAHGSYYCEVSNKAGKKRAYFWLAERTFPLQISTLRRHGVTSGAITLAWDPPASRPDVKDLGAQYAFRKDMKGFNITYTNIQRDNFTHYYHYTSGEYIDTKFFTWKTTISGLRVGEKYSYNIMAIDDANQKSFWSAPPFYYTIPENLPPYISKSPQDRTIERGDPLTIQCEVNADPPATVTWYKDGAVLSSSNSKYNMASSGIKYNLTISSVQRDDYGQYYCSATNKNGKVDSEKATIDVLYFDDTFRYTKEVAPIYRTDKFKELRILCIPPESNPSAKVFWSNSTHAFLPKTDDFIRDDAFKQQGITYFSILIKNPSNYVGTQVGCAAYNPQFGFNGRYKIAITNITAYALPELKKGVQHRWEAGPKLILTWEKERPDFVAYVIYVKKTVEPYAIIQTQNTKETTIDLINLPSEDLRIEVQVIDEGNQVSSPVVLQIPKLDVKPVEITKDLKSYAGEFKEGESTFLECDFSGEPTPHISWYKRGQNITINNGSFDVTNDNRRLNLNNLDRNIHQGLYQCVANNVFYRNVLSKLSQVDVIWIENEFKFADTEKFFYDLDGYRKVSFACSPPNANPPIDRSVNNYVIWLKGEESFNKDGITKKTVDDNGVLKDILEFDANKGDVGQYSCVYVHRAGNKRHNMTLNTYEGPLPPSNLQIEITRLNIVILKWDVPANEEIDTFVIKYGVSGLTETVRVAGTEKQHELKTLQELKTYKISLASETDGKTSLPLTDSFNTVKRPGLPTVVQNVAQEDVTNTTATIVWDAPANLNGNAKIRYFVKVCKSTVCHTYSDLESRKLVLTELEPASEYSFNITVRGDLDLNGPSFDGKFITVSNEGPPPVKNLRMLSKKWNLIEVQWDQPDKYEKVASYRVSVTGFPSVVIDRTATSYKAQGLKEGTVYTITLATLDAVSNMGTPTSIKEGTVDLTNPGQATQLQFEAYKGYEQSRIILTWVEPTESKDGNNVDLTYHLKYCSKPKIECFNKTSIRGSRLEIGGLLSNTEYDYTLTTLRDDGMPGGSAEGFFKTRPNMISEPSNPGLIDTQAPASTIYVSWRKPEVLAGTPDSNILFKITYCEPGPSNCREQTTTGLSMILRDLKPKTSYSIEIRARHHSGTYGEPAKLSATTASDGSTDDDDGMSAGTIVGIVLAVFIIIIIIVTVLLVYRKRRNAKMEGEKDVSDSGIKYSTGTAQRQMQQPPYAQNQQYRQPNYPQGHMYQQRDPYRGPPQGQYYHPSQQQQMQQMRPPQQQYRRPPSTGRPPSTASGRDLYEMEMARRR